MASDFNGDGRDDIFWRGNGVAGDHLGVYSNWLARPDGGFAPNDSVALVRVVDSWTAAGLGDFNGDGRDDILWRNYSSNSFSNWLGTPDGGFLVNDANAATSLSAEWFVLGTGDFNGDRRDDVMWTSEDTGSHLLLYGTASGALASGPTIALDPPHYSFAAGGDFNGDGRAEVVWRNSATGAIGTWSVGANGQRNYSNTVNPAASSDWSIAGVGDFNGDGRDDILWRNQSTGALSNWLGQANGSLTINDANAWHIVPVEWFVDSTGDYNGDGRDDILWRNYQTGGLSNWLGTPTGGFLSNDAAAYSTVYSTWQVQPNPTGAGEWDY